MISDSTQTKYYTGLLLLRIRRGAMHNAGTIIACVIDKKHETYYNLYTDIFLYISFCKGRANYV